MNKAWLILKHEFSQTIRRKSFIILTLAFPLLAVLAFGVYQRVQHWYCPPPAQELKIGFVDQIGPFREKVAQPGATFIRYSGEEEAKAALLAGISSIFPTARESSQWSAIFIMPAMVPIMLAPLIISQPDRSRRCYSFLPELFLPGRWLSACSSSPAQ